MRTKLLQVSGINTQQSGISVSVDMKVDSDKCSDARKCAILLAEYDNPKPSDVTMRMNGVRKTENSARLRVSSV